jgi:acyl-CoA synthetase (NDP forming)
MPKSADIHHRINYAMSHWLKPLLCPKSIAIVGASEREGSLAAASYQQLVDTRYSGAIYSINPKYSELYGEPCYAALSDLPVTPDLVIYAISGLVLESSFDEALVIGVGGIVIYASNYLENDSSPRLPQRLKQKATQAGIPVCGGNSMGFYNYDDNVMVSFDRPPMDRPAGHIGLILHSGSGLTYLANNDARFCYNYVIASAQETSATVGDYMDYLLDQTSTRVIAIMLETVRDVPVFISALEKARQKDIPVVITKLGRTEKSAQFATSHSGAIVGDHDAFVACCERYGVVLCKDLDEMIITAMLFATNCRIQSGAVASMLDSGGMRELMIDLADDYGVEFANISDGVRSVMCKHLDTGLEADNPLDAMGALGRNTHLTYLECGKALLDDSQTGLLTFEFEFRDGFSHYPELFDVVDQLANYNNKPIVVINSCTYTDLSETATRLTQRGIPVINGIDVALRSIRNLLTYCPHPEPLSTSRTQFDSSKLAQWQSTLSAIESCDEVTSLELMADFGLPTVAFQRCETLEQATIAANQLKYPLVMKTAEPGIAHKSDCGGVIVAIADQPALETAYQTLLQKLGSKVVIMPMVENGIEISLGMKNDAHYGPMVIVASGGILIELLNDRTFSLAPVTHEQAETMLLGLKLSKLLDGVRSQAAVNRESLVDFIVGFSELIYAFSDSIAEIDLNPVIVNAAGCTIVDALVVPAR